MANKVIVTKKKNYVPKFLKQRDINSYFKLCIHAWLDMYNLPSKMVPSVACGVVVGTTYLITYKLVMMTHKNYKMFAFLGKSIRTKKGILFEK